ncbi:trichohyalin-like [Teleopsis dalmanni]|uniref:trichohyalin-like n=1 Tax=Teleopsis dalmanni TaxID=139649 RepID=UPI0018CF1B89|nr:trichohyalin-like [Teleopsis dalmanni]
MARLKKQSAEERRAKARERTRLNRIGKDRSAEIARDNITRRKRRESQLYRKKEQERNNVSRLKRREDPEYRKKEQQKNTEAHARRRLDPEYKKKEQQRNTDHRRKRRQDPEYRAKERARDRELRKKRRQNPEIKAAEQEINTLKRTLRRLQNEKEEEERIKRGEIDENAPKRKRRKGIKKEITSPVPEKVKTYDLPPDPFELDDKEFLIEDIDCHQICGTKAIEVDDHQDNQEVVVQYVEELNVQHDMENVEQSSENVADDIIEKEFIELVGGDQMDNIVYEIINELGSTQTTKAQIVDTVELLAEEIEGTNIHTVFEKNKNNNVEHITPSTELENYELFEDMPLVLRIKSKGTPKSKKKSSKKSEKIEYETSKTSTALLDLDDENLTTSNITKIIKVQSADAVEYESCSKAVKHKESDLGFTTLLEEESICVINESEAQVTSLDEEVSDMHSLEVYETHESEELQTITLVEVNEEIVEDVAPEDNISDEIKISLMLALNDNGNDEKNPQTNDIQSIAGKSNISDNLSNDVSPSKKLIQNQSKVQQHDKIMDELLINENPELYYSLSEDNNKNTLNSDEDEDSDEEETTVYNFCGDDIDKQCENEVESTHSLQSDDDAIQVHTINIETNSIEENETDEETCKDTLHTLDDEGDIIEIHKRPPSIMKENRHREHSWNDKKFSKDVLIGANSPEMGSDYTIPEVTLQYLQDRLESSESLL